MWLIQTRWTRSEYEIESDGFRFVSFVHFWTFPALFHKFIMEGRGRVSEHSFSPGFALVTRGYRWKDKVWPGQDKFVHGWRVNTRLDGRAQCCMQRDIEPNEKQKDQCSVIILRCQRVRWKAVQDDIFALVVRDFHCPASNFFFFPKKDFSLFIYFKQREGMIQNKLWNLYSGGIYKVCCWSFLFIRDYLLINCCE